jgi:hypothetical protein
LRITLEGTLDALIHGLDHRGILGFALALSLRNGFVFGNHLLLRLKRRVDAIWTLAKWFGLPFDGQNC